MLEFFIVQFFFVNKQYFLTHKLVNHSTGFPMVYKHSNFYLTIFIFPFPIGTCAMCHLGANFVFLLAVSSVMVDGNTPPTIYHNQLWLAINNTYANLMSYGYVPFATQPTTSLRLSLGLATAKLPSAVIACYDPSTSNQGNQGLCSLWRTGLVSNSSNELQSLGLTGNPKCMVINSVNLGQRLKTTLFIYIFHCTSRPLWDFVARNSPCNSHVSSTLS